MQTYYNEQLKGEEAVSYTHLDVYKRQELLFSGDTVAAVQGTFTSEDRIISGSDRVVNVGDRVRPLSSAGDVYKRQDRQRVIRQFRDVQKTAFLCEGMVRVTDRHNLLFFIWIDRQSGVSRQIGPHQPDLRHMV